MLKFKKNAIQTLAKAVAKSKDSEKPEAVDFDIQGLNDSLRESLGLPINPARKGLSPIVQKTTAAPTPKKTETVAAEKSRSLEKALENIEKDAAQKEKTAAEEQARAEEQKKREAAALLAEEQKKETKRQEKIAEEKKRQEAEKNRIQEETRQRLILLEEEREKKKLQDLARQKKEAFAVNPFDSAAPEIIVDAHRDLPAILKELAAKLKQKKSDLEKQLLEIPAQKAPLEQKRTALESKIEMIKKSELAAIEELEKEIESKIEAEKTKVKENQPTEQEKTVKEKIWENEEQRKKIEKQRWDVEDRVFKIAAETENIVAEIMAKDSQAEFIKSKIKDIGGKEKIANFAAEKNRLEEEILKIIEEKEALLPDFESAKNSQKEKEADLAKAAKEENEINIELEKAENMEKTAADPAEKRAAERQRWDIGEKLKSIVRLKWENQKSLKEIAAKSESLRNKIGILDAKIDRVQNEIATKEAALEKENLPVRQIRDLIGGLLDENQIKYEKDVLKDIIQTQPEEKQTASELEDPVKQAVPDQTKKETAKKNDPLPRDNETHETAIEAKKNVPMANDLLKPRDTAKSEPQQKTAAKTDGTDGLAIKNIQNEIQKATPAAVAANNSSKEKPLDKKSLASDASAFYREKIESQPTKNIPSLDRLNLPKEKPTAAPETQNVKKETISNGINEKTAAPEFKSLEQPPELARNLENRWQQIKKTTVPSANPAAVREYGKKIEIDPLPVQKKSGDNKLLARMMVILVLAGLFGVILVMILSKNSAPSATKKAEPPAKTTAIKKTPAEKEPEPANTSPVSTISLITIYLDDVSNIPNLLYPNLLKKMEDGYHGVEIKNKVTGAKIGVRQFLSAYKINPPAAFYNSTGDEINLFIYAKNGKNRLGFVAAAANPGTLKTALSAWEKTAIADTNYFFSRLDRKPQDEKEILKFEISQTAKGIEYKSVDFKPAGDNFALAWAIYEQKYFAFSTSNDSLVKLFDQLPN